jgi:hypothetical protein
MLTLLALAAIATIGADPDTVLVEVDTARNEVAVTVPGITIPVGTHYHHEGSDANAAFVWPAGGWVRGYRVKVLDASGAVLPRETLHHVGIVTMSMRQLAYPKALRLFAAGTETDPVLLPESMGVRLNEGEPMVIYYALVNQTDRNLEGVSLRIVHTWRPEGSAPEEEIRPLILDANPDLMGPSQYDLPPGISAMHSEFALPTGGRVRAMGGHLHDHAVEIRLEDVITGKVLVRLAAEYDRSGRLERVGTSRFLLSRGGLRLEANRPYRVVAIYDNPTGATIPGGAMAYMGGPFRADDLQAWPEIDPDDPVYRADLQGLIGQELPAESYVGHEHHDH